MWGDAHVAKECRSRLKPCTLAPCMYTITHNEEGHKVMLDRGITVIPDRLPTTPWSANNTNNSKPDNSQSDKNF